MSGSAEDAVAAVLADAGLAAGAAPEAIRTERLAGGSIADVRRVRWPGGDAVVKLAPAGHHERLAAEAGGLAAIAETGTIRVPAVLGHGRAAGQSVLLLEWLEPVRPDDPAWERFGRQLAAMHAAAAPAPADNAGDGAHRYGWAGDTWLGTTRLPASRAATWPELLVERRLRPLVQATRDAGTLSPDDAGLVGGALDRLDRELPPQPHPALLHGDLWSGNAHGTRDREGRPAIALIDPAAQVGDGWSELGMMRLFGGFPPACFAAYAEAAGGRPDDAGLRIAAGRLLHALNHLAMFGGGYRASVIEAVELIRRA